MPHKLRYALTLTSGTLLGLGLRSWRLDWQPLWWDEGYSVYFATEPLARMVWLTGHDIHPPLYYALLHGWLLWLHSAQPTILRLFSVFSSIISLPLLGWFTYLLFPKQPRRWFVALLLLLVNPLHLFYSQEVRMYALAMTLGLVSTLCCWLFTWADSTARRQLAGAGYLISSVLALYTLYYLALLVLAQLLWLGWTQRYQRRRLLDSGLLYLLIGLCYLPWLLYAGPNLFNYVLADKIPADADQPLGPLAYLLRHGLAFTAGHLEPKMTMLEYLLWIGVAAVGLLWGVGIRDWALGVHQRKVTRLEQPIPNPYSLLWSCLLIPTLIALLVNFRLPFFPQGGERLLLFVLPYFLVLVSGGIDQSWQRWSVGRGALIGLLLSASSGVWLFYTTPRYRADDYRPVIRQITQQGQAGDTWLAIFPWQVGYWRAYSPAPACQLDTAQCQRLQGLDPQQAPTLLLAGDSALTWGTPLQSLVDQALTAGSLWLVAPLNLGSTLPASIERYLHEQQVTALEQRWVSSTTQLSAWRRLPQPTLAPLAVDFGRVRLTGAGLAPTHVASANQPINVALQWQTTDEGRDLGVTLRLQDESGQVWANRDYQPLGSNLLFSTTEGLMEQAGMLIPVGLPPASYQLLLGVTISGTEQLLAPQSAVPDQTALVALGVMSITQPSAPLPPFQLPIQKFAPRSPASQPLRLLGYAGNLANAALLAGEPVDLTIFLQASQPTPDQQLYVSLLDVQGAGVAGWEGWSPAQGRSSQWSPGTLVQAPVTFFTPATLATGDYQLIAGLLDPATGSKSTPTPLDQVQIRQRPAHFTAPQIPQPLDQPVRFGTHVDLLGYELERQPDSLQLTLYWQVQQTLLPPHHIFVHLDEADGTTVAQDDGAPSTPTGPAPTGTWQPGEYLITEHQVLLPPGPVAVADAGTQLRVGFYLPVGGERLPATQAGVSIGDVVEIVLK